MIILIWNNKFWLRANFYFPSLPSFLGEGNEGERQEEKGGNYAALASPDAVVPLTFNFLFSFATCHLTFLWRKKKEK